MGDWQRFPVPRLWSDATVDSPDGSRGIATYRATLKLPQGASSLMLTVGSPMTAYRLFIDGQPRGGVGEVGTTAATTTAKLENRDYPLPAGLPSVEILVHVANFEFRGGGLRRTWTVGETEQIRAQNSFSLLRYSAFAVACLVIGRIFLAQFAFRPSDKARGWFGALAVLVGVRLVPGSTSDQYQLLLGWASFDLLTRLDYINTALVTYAAGGYLQAKVAGFMPQRLTPFVRYTALALVPIHLLAPLDGVLATLSVIMATPIVGLVLVLISYWRAYSRGLPDAGSTLAAASLIAVGVSHDVFRTATGLGGPIEFFPYFVLVRIAAETYSLLGALARTFATTERLSDALHAANFELQKTEAAVVRFVAFDWLRALGKQSIREVESGDHVRQEVTVMATRLDLAEPAAAEAGFAPMNRQLAIVGDRVHQHGGYIQQHLGPELLAVFPSAAAAVAAGIELRGNLGARVAIATGMVSMGTVGDTHRLSTVMVGGVVTLGRCLVASDVYLESKLVVCSTMRDRSDGCANWPETKPHDGSRIFAPSTSHSETSQASRKIRPRPSRPQSAGDSSARLTRLSDARWMSKESPPRSRRAESGPALRGPKPGTGPTYSAWYNRRAPPRSRSPGGSCRRQQRGRS